MAIILIKVITVQTIVRGQSAHMPPPWCRMPGSGCGPARVPALRCQVPGAAQRACLPAGAGFQVLGSGSRMPTRGCSGARCWACPDDGAPRMRETSREVKGWREFLDAGDEFLLGDFYSTPFGVGRRRCCYPAFHAGLFMFNPFGIGRARCFHFYSLVSENDG